MRLMREISEVMTGTWMVCVKEHNIHPLGYGRTVPVGHLAQITARKTSPDGVELFAAEFFEEKYWFPMGYFAVADQEACERMATQAYPPKVEIVDVHHKRAARFVSLKLAVPLVGRIDVLVAPSKAPTTAKPPLPRAATRAQVQPIGLRVGR
jgi:hypothetical protein